ncbi:TonB family protein [Brevundimonas sp.]|jgi:TonB family protein|uniref:TonB family protein n=1 Tax=Brevundimonas sp. TaxID=1871086 RepID=UPI0037C0FE35
MRATALSALALGLAATSVSAQDRIEYLDGPLRPLPTPDATSLETAAIQLPSASATCGDVAVQPLVAEEFAPTAFTRGGPVSDGLLDFSIADDGRTLDIRPVQPSSIPVGVRDNAAPQAVLAGWRFPAEAHKDCRLTIRWRTLPLAQAETDTSDLMKLFAVSQTTRPIRQAVALRLGGDGADCGDRWGGRRPSLVSYPDFLTGRRPSPGARTWTIVRWNIDAAGEFTDVETLGSSGDADLDAETRRAISDSSAKPGPARKGCVANYYRWGEPLPAPPLPPEDQRKDPLQNCPAEIGERFKARRDLIYPAAFSQRSIEGWALVRFDIAPWGAIGNVEVIESQPAAAFGDDARRMVQGSTATPAFNAGIRCVVPVRYRMGESLADDDAATGAASAD